MCCLCAKLSVNLVLARLSWGSTNHYGEVQIIMGKYYKSCFLVAQPGKLFSQKYSQTGCSLANNIAILSHNIAILIVTQIAQSNLQAYTNKLQVEIHKDLLDY